MDPLTRGPAPRRRCPGGRNRPAGGRAGFVLAETLVAFAVLAVGLGLIVTGIAVALRSDGRAAANRAALREAQRLLARAGLVEPLATSDRHGGEPGSARWRMTTIRVVPAAAETATAGAPPPLAAFWVDVTVSMPDGSGAALAGLKLAQRR